MDFDAAQPPSVIHHHLTDLMDSDDGSSGALNAIRSPLPWITVAEGSGYFLDTEGKAWTPIGHNESISWPHLVGLFRRRDIQSAEHYLSSLAARGVTCLRLMLEYAQVRHRYIERPTGTFVPDMVQLWDDLFAMCEQVGLRILLTPVDTFWTWLHWRHHPWNRVNGGPCDRPSRLLICPETRRAIKERLGFAVRRWGGTGALFAWDLWNEIHPAQAEGSADGFGEFIQDLSQHVRSLERDLYGQSHLQTVSLFGPELLLNPQMNLRGPIFHHRNLDFATIHIYETGTIDDPRDTVEPARAMGRIVGECLGEIRDHRPFLDTEHGPIHRFKDKHQALPEAFDDQYFRHMSWAHLASGGAGGGMRWPNRHPHVLTAGMHRAQEAMAAFLPLIDWTRLQPRALGDAVRARGFHVFACGDEGQIITWLLRQDAIDSRGMLPDDLPAQSTRITWPIADAGEWHVRLFDTKLGEPIGERRVVAAGGYMTLRLDAVGGDLAIAWVRVRADQKHGNTGS